MTLPVPPTSRAAPAVPAAVLRRAVLEHASSERRREFPPRLHAGRPGELDEAWLDVAPPLDLAVRSDVVSALVRRATRDAEPSEPTLVWLTRRGPLEVHDGDLGWAAAVGRLRVERARRLLFVVVTKRGWLDPLTGRGREWQRIRDRRGQEH